MDAQAIQRRYDEALASLIEQVRADRSVLAALLCGSLAYDRVWEASDIDLVLVTIDDRLAADGAMTLDASGVNVHALLMPRGEFRRIVEGSLHNSFAHSFLARGRLLYTHDQTIADLCARLPEIGERDTRVRLLRAATSALPPVLKAHKWLATRGDLDYTALWILHAATPLAQIEVIGARLIADREVIPQALKLNPGFFKIIYADLLNAKKTTRSVRAALDAVDEYLDDRVPTLFAPLLEHLREVGEARSCTEIEDHCARSLDVTGVTTACEYLADRGLLGRASAPVKLTRRSNVEVQELAFFYLTDAVPSRRVS